MKMINMYVGSYTDADDRNGIYQIEYNPKLKELEILSINSESDNPSYLLSDGDIVYAGNEINGNGHLSSFIKNEAGQLTLNDAIRAQGDGVCHIYKNFDVIYGSNYGSGSVFAVSVTDDGYFHKVISGYDHLQEGAHAHSAIASKDNRYLYVADLGDDCIYNYQIKNDGSLMVHPIQTFLSVGKDSGPRHMTLHPKGHFLYVVSEFSNRIKIIDVNADGTLALNTKISLPVIQEEAYAADIKFDHAGRYLYVSYRGANTIVVYELLSNDDLKYVSMHDCGGHWPRHFSITEDDRYLIVANQKSNNVSVLEIKDDGSLSKPQAAVEVKKPTCILID